MTVTTSAEADNPTRWRLRTRVPDDWVELAGTTTAEEALGTIRSALEQVGTPLPEADASRLLAGLQSWRDMWRRERVLLHGLVYQGAEHDGPTALGREIFWNVIGTVRPVTAFDGPLSLLEVIRRVIGAKAGIDLEQAYTETFETGVGPALGLTTEYEATYREPGAPDDVEPVRRTVGLAAVVAAPKSGGPALMLLGFSTDPAQVRGLGMLLAAMAGPATITPVDKDGNPLFSGAPAPEDLPPLDGPGTPGPAAG
ncbi:hypothetical protein ACFQBY_10580 [Promicromonospora citrea]|uniref:Uncharacterized protein n=1 Tax=Promicromonospora citrea TaxID=43677 RepID=A0A8H9L626_9MICO|nr:hypothetical protein [Promicromonospora citrea]NNH51438.1 hypothetical protein [Promicromonospora citrea]GGM35131.1 hypothetical protein GCM10010102_33140 [Promicromonospora citrea]HEV6952610.1 hypothetical protein [Promicromonospora sp.]